MNIAFQEEKIENVYVEAYPLFEKHNDEVGEGLKLDFNIDYYLEQNEDGLIRFYTLRDENELIGYAVYCLGHCANHKTKIVATESGVFILKDKRGSGLPFITFCEQQLKELGVSEVIQIVPIKSKWGRFLEYKGYVKTEVMYCKEI